MKKLTFSLFFAAAFSFAGFAQTVATTEFSAGSIDRLNNEKTTGTIKLMFKARGVIIFVNTAGKKEQLSPNDLAGFQVNNDTYTSYASDFYKIQTKGAKMNLLQRVTDNSGKIFYNGSQAVNSSSLSGKVGDIYLQKASSDEFLLVSAANFEQLAGTVFADCPSISAEIKNKQIGFAQLSAAVERYNTCK